MIGVMLALVSLAQNMPSANAAGMRAASLLAENTTLVVNSSSDHFSDGCTLNGEIGIGWRDCTLHEAIERENTTAGPDTITFSPSVFGINAIITLEQALPAIADNLTIYGDSGNGAVRISGADLYQIFFVNSGKKLNLQSTQ